MKQILQYLFNHQTLTKAEAKAIMIEIAQINSQRNRSFCVYHRFMMRKHYARKMQGFREALLDLAVKVDLGTHDLVDIVGTGGDGKNTFNISTLASFIVAGTGQKSSETRQLWCFCDFWFV